MVKVSVIMGVYNDEKTVGKAIESIVCQSFQDWVLFICDDGSKDNTFDVLNGYQKKYPDKITVFRNVENKGLAYTLNKMIDKVDTEYIARMDADDISHRERLSQQVSYLDMHSNIALLGSSINKFDEKGIFKTVIYPHKPQKSDLMRFNTFAHPTIMIRTKVMRELNGYRDIQKTRRCEDYDLWFRLYEKEYTGDNIDIPLLDYYEGRSTYKKRKFKYRLNEMLVRMEGYKRNHLYPSGLLYFFKPIIAGFVPTSLMYKYKSTIQRKNL